LDKGTLKNANFKAKVDGFETPVLTASGEADLKKANGGAFARTLNPSGSMSKPIVTSDNHASMDSVAEQGQLPVTTVDVT
jgi:hypothetical protein